MNGNEVWRTHSACRVHTRVNARQTLDTADYFAEATKRSHECERGTQECVRHEAGVTLIELLIAVLSDEPAFRWYRSYAAGRSERHEQVRLQADGQPARHECGAHSGSGSGRNHAGDGELPAPAWVTVPNR